MKDANALALESYTIADLVKIVNDYEELKTHIETMEETIQRMDKINDDLSAENEELRQELEVLINGHND